MCNIKDIEKEHWKHAEGIKCAFTETTSALATRDYSVSCSNTTLLLVIKGYHIWWCTAHHQPLAKCEQDKAYKKLRKAEEKLELIGQCVMEEDNEKDQ